MRAERVGPDDWREWRALRLEALRDYPLGFVRTYEESVLQPEQDWREWLARPGAFFLLRPDAGTAVGMCGTWADDAGTWLGAVHLQPAVRGRGLLGVLVEAAAGWAREQGADRLLLEVHEDNARARRAYARLGFVETGARVPYPLPPGGEEVEMALAL